MIKVPNFKEEGYKGVRGMSIDTAIDRALKNIDEERKGKQNGLYCRWLPINIIQGKYWRFGKVHLMASASGHGKSYVSNMLVEDFSDLRPIYNSKGEHLRDGLNQDFKEDVIILNFSMENDPEDEIIRNLGRFTKSSYSKLTSAEYNQDKNEFIALHADDFEYAERQSNILKGRPVYYFPDQSNVTQIFYTVQAFAKLNPTAKIVIFIDHTFLIKKLSHGQTDLGLVQDVAHLLLALRKTFNACVVATHQLNQKIEDFDRMINREQHYPKSSDIYMVNEIKWACDNIFVFPYRPALITLKTYSPKKYYTSWLDENNIKRDLIVCSKVKSRNGFLADIYFEERLSEGKIIYKSEADIPRETKAA